MLAPGEYQLLQIEAPPVPAAEMRRAASWRVRELIDFPVDQAVVDTFDPPEAAQQRGQAQRRDVAVARRSVIAERVELNARAGSAPRRRSTSPSWPRAAICARLPARRASGHALSWRWARPAATVYRGPRRAVSWRARARLRRAARRGRQQRAPPATRCCSRSSARSTISRARCRSRRWARSTCIRPGPPSTRSRARSRTTSAGSRAAASPWPTLGDGGAAPDQGNATLLVVARPRRRPGRGR
ncbi:MAG: hypothetical protein U5K43_04970 [Halofilum sp. (in: g-proteobacteria)]|nr:hypothetical protein [Halofilum sp. (in: g-proteobacteria)]